MFCIRCEQCGKSFSRSDHLKKHTLSHHNNTIQGGGPGGEAGYENMETDFDPTQMLEVN